MSKNLDSAAAADRRRLDQSIASPAGAAQLRQRLDQSLDRRAARQPRYWLAAVSAACAMVVAGVWYWQRPEPSWYRVVAGNDCLERGVDGVGATTICGTRLVLAVGRDQITLSSGTRLDRRGTSLALRRGRGVFQIAPRKPGAEQFRLHVSHGTIEVTGTLFEVEQLDERGSITLTRGDVRFRWADGSGVERLTSGEVLRWPRPQPVDVENDSAPSLEPQADTTTRPRDVRPKPSAARPSIEEVLELMFRLRSQKRYDDAIELLGAAVARTDFTSVQRERLSYELGWVLENGLADHAAACAHWRRHATRFKGVTDRTDMRELLSACAGR